MRRPVVILAIVCAPAFAEVAWAQQSGVVLQVGSRSLEVGEAVDAQLVCTNIGDPGPPALPPFEGLEVTVTNPTPFFSQSVSIVNGRRSQTVTHTFPLRIVAVREGNHVLDPIRVKAGGREYATDAVTFVVRTAQPTGARGDRFLFVEVEASPRKLYVTQSVQATLTIGIRKVVVGGREYEVDMIRQVLDLQGSQLSVFENGSARQSETSVPDSNGQNHDYVVFRVAKEIRAEQVGRLSIGPVFLRAEYPTALRPSLLGRLEVTRTRKETARAESIEIEVTGPPIDGRPASFTGAIGQFEMQVLGRPDRVRQGEPVTLTIRIAGAPLDGLAAPNLARFTDLAGRFDFTPDELVGDLEGGAKVFRKAIFPKRAGEQTVPPIEWSYFDPQAERYVVLSSAPIPITVDAGVPGDDLIALSANASDSERTPKLRVLTGGIQPNFVDVSLLAASRTDLPSAAAVGLSLALPPILFAGCRFVAGRRHRIASDKGYARRSRARRRAEKAMRESERRGGGRDATLARAAALSEFLCDRFGWTTGTMTPADAETLVRRHGLDIAAAAAIREFLERSEAIRFAPIEADADMTRFDQRTVLDWIRSIESCADRLRSPSS